MTPERKSSQTWEDLARLEPARIWRTSETAGRNCARDGCSVTKSITFDKPLCYPHWKEFDALGVFECERCH